MKINQKKLNKAIVDYKDKYHDEPTHAFVFSHKQKDISKECIYSYNSVGIPKRRDTYINGVEYTECRDLSSENKVFGWNDARFVGVGTLDDVTFK